MMGPHHTARAQCSPSLPSSAFFVELKGHHRATLLSPTVRGGGGFQGQAEEPCLRRGRGRV